MDESLLCLCMYKVQILEFRLSLQRSHLEHVNKALFCSGLATRSRFIPSVAKDLAHNQRNHVSPTQSNNDSPISGIL